MGVSWTVEEERILLENYPDIGMDVTALLPHRTLASIRGKARKLGIVVETPQTGKRGSRAWTAEELNTLVTQYPNIGCAVVDLLPDRTIGAIRHQITKLGLASDGNVWSEAEMDSLRENYNEMTKRELGTIINRTENAMRLRAHSKGISRERSVPWSDEEVATLKKYYGKEGTGCQKYLPGRTDRAIRVKANRLGLRFQDSVTGDSEE